MTLNSKISSLKKDTAQIFYSTGTPTLLGMDQETPGFFVFAAKLEQSKFYISEKIMLDEHELFLPHFAFGRLASLTLC